MWKQIISRCLFSFAIKSKLHIKCQQERKPSGNNPGWIHGDEKESTGNCTDCVYLTAHYLSVSVGVRWPETWGFSFFSFLSSDLCFIGRKQSICRQFKYSKWKQYKAQVLCCIFNCHSHIELCLFIWNYELFKNTRIQEYLFKSSFIQRTTLSSTSWSLKQARFREWAQWHPLWHVTERVFSSAVTLHCTFCSFVCTWNGILAIQELTTAPCY